jgi:hypothetical protein
MKRLTLLLVLAAATPAAAQQPPHLDFVRGLRARGMPELALDYLKQLERRADLPPEVRAIIPLEIARTQVETAERHADAAVRQQLVKDALAEFERFANSPANQKNPLIAEAHLEVGKLISEQGRAKAVETREAFRKRDFAQTRDLGNEAMAVLDRAAKSLQTARDRFEPRLNALNATDPKQKGERYRLLEAFLLTQLLRGQLLYEKADIADLIAETLRQSKLPGEATFRETAGKAAQEASRVFDDVAGRRQEHPLGWIGYAWYGRSQDGVDEGRRDAAWKAVESSKLDTARPAQRLVAYFRILSEVRRDPGPQGVKERELRQVKLETWLRTYAGGAAPYTKPPANFELRRVFDGPEGQHVRYLLASSYRDELAAFKPDQREQPRFLKLNEQTLAILASLEEQGGEYAAVARQVKFQVRRLDAQLLTVPVVTIGSFDDLLLRASMEGEQAREIIKKADETKDEAEKKALQAKAGGHVDNMLAALRRGMRLMPESAGAVEREQLYGMLFGAYVQQEDYTRAAVVLEHLARDSRSRPAMAQEGAERALDLYRRLVNSNRANAAVANADMRRLVAVAELVVVKYPTLAAADEARFLLGFVYEGQRRFNDAATNWAAVTAKNPNHGEASYRAGDLSWKMHVTKVLYPDDPKNKKPITTPTPELMNALNLLNRCLTWFANQKPDPKPDPKKPAPPVDRKTPVLATFRLAQIYSYLSRHADVIRLTDPLVDQLVKDTLPKDLPEGMTGDILSISLRTHVQMKNLDRARAVLKILQTKGAQGQLGDSFNRIVAEMGNQLRAQITALEAQGKPAEPQLRATKESFRGFLTQVRDDTNLGPDMLVWVGSSYMGLGDFVEAAKVFSSATWPGEAPKLNGNEEPKEREKILAMIDEHERKAAHFRRCLLLRVTSLRRGAVAESDAAKKAALFAEAQQVLSKGMADAGVKNHPQFIQEDIFILQDKGEVSGPNGAITRWDQLRSALQPHAVKGGVLGDVYLESCYNLVVCKFIEAKKLEDAKVQQAAMKRTAELFVIFSKNDQLRPRLDKFLQDPAQDELRKEVEALTKVG